MSLQWVGLVRRRVGCWVAILALALGGCANSDFHADDPNLTPEQRTLRQEAQRFNQTIGEGAVIGAVVGAAAGALLMPRNPIAGAVVGGVAGAALGGGAGYLVAVQNRSYANREDRLRAGIEASRQDVARLQNVVTANQRVVTMHRATITRLNAEYRAGRISADQYREQAAGVRRDIGAMSSLITENQRLVQAYDQEIASMRRSGANTSEMAGARTGLQQRLQALQSQYDDLVRVVGDAPIQPTT